MHLPFAFASHKPTRIIAALIIALAFVAMPFTAASTACAASPSQVGSSGPEFVPYYMSPMLDDEPPGVPPFDPSYLRELILGLLYTGGLGAAVFWIMDNWQWVGTLDPRVKRIVVAPVLSLVLVLPLLLFSVWMGWTPAPARPQDWVNTVITLAAITFMASQFAHAAAVKPKQTADGDGPICVNGSIPGPGR